MKVQKFSFLAPIHPRATKCLQKRNREPVFDGELVEPVYNALVRVKALPFPRVADGSQSRPPAASDLVCL